MHSHSASAWAWLFNPQCSSASGGWTLSAHCITRQMHASYSLSHTNSILLAWFAISDRGAWSMCARHNFSLALKPNRFRLWLTVVTLIVVQTWMMDVQDGIFLRSTTPLVAWYQTIFAVVDVLGSNGECCTFDTRIKCTRNHVWYNILYFEFIYFLFFQFHSLIYTILFCSFSSISVKFFSENDFSS